MIPRGSTYPRGFRAPPTLYRQWGPDCSDELGNFEPGRLTSVSYTYLGHRAYGLYMGTPASYSIQVDVESLYVEAQSIPESQRYVFAYTVTIRNTGDIPAKLLTRHWIITDSNGKSQEVRGEGVVGEHPHLHPGEAFQYTSGTMIETSVGSMRGSYQMIADDGVEFDAEVPAFTLSIPRVLH